MEFPKLSAMVPQPHQRVLARKIQEHPGGQVAVHGLGSGKTFASINAAVQSNLPILAVVPASLRNNYKKELAATGFKKPALVVSYQEALKYRDSKKFKDFASKALVVYDEGHRLGQATSMQSKLPQLVKGKKTLVMTATPIRNSPEEIAPLVNAITPGALPTNPTEFKNRFMETREVPVGFWGRVLGAKPGTEVVPVNLHEFRQAVRGKVDFFSGANRSDYPSFDETVFEVPMSDKQEAAYNWVMGKYPTLSYRVRHGLPLGKDPDTDFRAFMIGPRQISNHPASFNRSATDEDAPKISTMADEIERRYKRDKNFRGVSYSAFLDSGVLPLSRELMRRGIPHELFTGGVSDKERQRIITGYNAGKTPVLLISGAGAEGLDLKGTKLMQIMEPHWNEEMIDQVRGRAIRYKSHAHLPEGERHVEVQRFHSIPRMSLWDTLMGRKRAKEMSADEFIYDTAKKKKELNQAFVDAMQDKTSSWQATIPVDDKKFPAILVDLDDTLVTQPGGYTTELRLQERRPNTLEILTSFKDKGYKIVGVTNRSIYDSKTTPDELIALNDETMGLYRGVLDDIVFMLYGPTEFHKPAPTMLQYAMAKYSLDEENTIFVGDQESDAEAARAAGLPFVYTKDFFADPSVYGLVCPAEPRDQEEKDASGEFEQLYAKRRPLEGDEKDECLKRKAVWHKGLDASPVPAVWKSEREDGTVVYVTNTHRLYRVSTTLDGAIKEYFAAVKGTT